MKKSSAHPFTLQAALEYAAALCSRSEQCEADLRRKFFERSLPAADAETAVNWLYDHNFLNEKRFACAFARDKARFNHWGRVKIRLHLQARKISSDSIAEALNAIDEAEYVAGLESIARSQARNLDLTLYDDRLKLGRRLLSRGFESNLVSQTIKALARSQHPKP